MSFFISLWRVLTKKPHENHGAEALNLIIVSAVWFLVRQFCEYWRPQMH